mgnify:CR=1 FL=1
MQEKRLPEFPLPVERVSYADGCKVYFGDKGWMICRFSGTEPLLRIFCEMRTEREARELCDLMEDYLGLQ